MEPFAPRSTEPRNGDAPEFQPREYEPIQPRGTDVRAMLKKLATPLIVLFGILLKLGSIAKFGTIFIAFGGYTLIWGWKFALGVIVLIFVHEMGHYLEAARERLSPQWPVFLPFLGAYVKHTRGNPWQTTRVAVAGPILGGIGALAFFVVGQAYDSDLLMALAFFGFIINLFNLLPLGPLDGGHIWRSTRWLWYGGGRQKAYISGALFAATALLLLLGALQSYVPQSRL